MAKAIKPKKIGKGDFVTITTPMATRSGVVISAQNYRQNGCDNWYIELEDQYHGYCYWKQALDDGSIVEHRPA